MKLGVKNIGKKTSPKFTSDLYMDGKLMGSVNYPTVAAGKTVYGTIALSSGILYAMNKDSGIQKFKNVVDPKNKIVESHENNNAITEISDLTPLTPYLEISEFHVLPNYATAMRTKKDGKTIYTLDMHVTTTVVIRNICSRPLKQILIILGGTLSDNDGSVTSNLKTVDFSKNPIKPGEREIININATVLYYNNKLGSIPERIEASGVDSINVRGFVKEGVLGHIIQNVFKVN